MTVATPLTPSSDVSDDEVVERVRAGDVASYEILMRRHNRRVYRVIRAILRDESEVEDVMQETYLASYRGLHGFAGDARFSTWLIRIAVNRSLDVLRRSGRFVPFDPSSDENAGLDVPLARDRDPEQQIGERQLARLLEEAIDALPAGLRAAYVLRELEGVETADAARCLGVEEGTIKTRVHRARRRLREALGQRLGSAATDELFRFGGERCDRIVAAVLARL